MENHAGTPEPELVYMPVLGRLYPRMCDGAHFPDGCKNVRTPVSWRN